MLDPRGFKVHPIGPPTTAGEQGKHWLYTLVSSSVSRNDRYFDRSWYGRVLAERWTSLSTKHWKRAFNEITSLRTCSMAST
ncbi:MAG: hypothetical protein IPK04_18740 [Bdellovibrionales bacterium]|nr:hypothetical protein [Bdellovibrionales bacterium]